MASWCLSSLSQELSYVFITVVTLICEENILQGRSPKGKQGGDCPQSFNPHGTELEFKHSFIWFNRLYASSSLLPSTCLGEGGREDGDWRECSVTMLALSLRASAQEKEALPRVLYTPVFLLEKICIWAPKK